MQQNKCKLANSAVEFMPCSWLHHILIHHIKWKFKKPTGPCSSKIAVFQVFQVVPTFSTPPHSVSTKVPQNVGGRRNHSQDLSSRWRDHEGQRWLTQKEAMSVAPIVFWSQLINLTYLTYFCPRVEWIVHWTFSEGSVQICIQTLLDLDHPPYKLMPYVGVSLSVWMADPILKNHCMPSGWLLRRVNYQP